MADKERKSLPKFTSPKGPFKFPKIKEPDYGTKDYPKPEGEYSTKLVLKAASPEAKSFIKSLTPAYEEALAAAREEFKALKPETRKKLKEITVNPLFTELLDKETEQPTGEIEFKFSMKASGEYKKGPKAGQRWTRKPDVFDAKGNRIPKCPDVWGGTIGRVSFEASPYFIPATGAAGLSLKLTGIQIVELVSGGSKSAKDHGFEADEDGYEYTPENETNTEDQDAVASSTEGDDEF